MASTLWVESLRPKTLDEIVGHEGLKEMLLTTEVDKIPNILLYGSPGTGKTSLALALVSAINPKAIHQTCHLYLNASDERKLEKVRERISTFLYPEWFEIRRKVIILDEIETMTEPAQLALRSFMDIPKGALFILICNSLSRVVVPIHSRVLSVFCENLSALNIKKIIQRRLPESQISQLTCQFHRGDMRSLLHLIQQDGVPAINKWTIWLQRLFNAPDLNGCCLIFDDALSKIPACILFRFILIFCYEISINNSISKECWDELLSLFILNRKGSQTKLICEVWMKMLDELKGKKFDEPVDDST